MLSYNALHLKKSLQPPYLEDALTDQKRELEDAPPFDPRIGAFCRVPVCALAANDVALLVLDLRDELCHVSDFPFQGILRRFRFGHVDNAVDVEGHLLGVGAPMFVVEAVRVFAVFFGGEGVIAARDTTLVDFEGVGGCLDPKVNFQVAAASEFPVADLEGDGHLVVLVQGLVETLALVGLHLDAVRRRSR